MLNRIELLLGVLLVTMQVSAQNYSAIHGSNYAGGLGVYNNPSSIVNGSYPWDVTLFGIQYQTISNAVRGPNFPLNLSPNSEFSVAEGNYKRFADINYNVRLLNTRIALNADNAVAFGLNMRGYVQLNSGRLNYNDQILGTRTFLQFNEENRSLNADVTSNLWMEFFASYARTVWNNETSRLNAGGTLKLLRGMSGAFANVEGIGVFSETNDERTEYKVNGGTGTYGFSANHGDGSEFSAGDFFSGGKTSFAVDLGMEYLVKSQAISSFYDDAEEQDYDWKIGLSLLDIGWNNYEHSEENRRASQLRDDISSSVLYDKFTAIRNLSDANDSIATIVDSYEILQGNFRIMNPARAVINVDKYISGNVYVNAELTVNLAASNDKNFAVRESRLLAITPRWETRRLGFYAPVQVTRHGNFWIGGAVKLGPVLLGTHNLLNAFLKNKYLAGGAYIAVTIRPSNLMRTSRNQQYECPEY